MQNKGAVKLLAIALALVCLYQLSFTWFTTKIETKAKEYAKNDLNKEYHFLDSIQGEVVYNFLWLYPYTYRDCKERQINLGLDLKGGMNVILEVKVEDVIKALSNYSNDSLFVKAIAQTKRDQISSPGQDFVTLFGKAFERIAPNAKLAAIFSTSKLKDKVNYNSSNNEVIKVLHEEANAAIDNSFSILQTRIDKFGVVQPVMQQLQTKGQIEVQLPGVREPERVRKLLQGTANLEFWTTYENTDIINSLAAADKLIAQINSAKKANEDSVKNVGKSNDAKVSQKQNTSAEKDSSLSALKSALKKGNEKDTLKGLQNQNTLFSLLYPMVDRQGQPYPGARVGSARIRDTAKIGEYLRLKQVRALFPKDLRLLWGDKPHEKKSEVLELYAIKVSTRDGRAPLDGSVIVDARGDYGQNKSSAEVTMSMNGEGAKTWAKLTKENLGHCIAIVLDNAVKSAPNVTSEIPNGSSVITGMADINEAKDLAVVLKAGKMPAPAGIISEDIVGPSLGKESITASMWSFIIAFIGVLLYMWLYYGRAGSVANIALFANVFFLFGVFASMGLVLTLPGIAGIVLTLAMAVDGNVIIYERMREEVRAGKGERMVVKDGFWHAYSAIIDGHVTTILTGIVLFLFGTGPVKGFATSLIVGLLLSLFSSIFIARLMFESMLDRNMRITLGNRFTINAMTKVNIDFIGLRKIMYVASGIVILIGIISLFTRGLDPSVDFKGGRTYIIDFGKPVVTADIQKSLTKTLMSAPEVKTIGTENRVKITTKYLIDEKSDKTDSIVNTRLYEGIKGYFVNPISYEEFSTHSNTKKVGELSSQRVDPVISTKLIYKALMAVFFGLIIIFIYIAIRFKNWKYGLGGVVSLFHDTIIVTSLFSLFYGILPFSLEVDQQFIAALLTIIGYSIMDTVIIYDRIREYKKLYPSRPLEENINTAINHTLGRTINTSGITVVVLVVMFIFGGDMLRGFIFALLSGVIIGTYSSVFNATPVAYDIIRLTEKKKKQK